jgi:hypothetical protein
MIQIEIMIVECLGCGEKFTLNDLKSYPTLNTV